MFVLITAALIVFYYVIQKNTSVDPGEIAPYFKYGFFGLMIALMIVLISGVVLRSLWTQVMRRADSVELCCPDHNDMCTHIVTRHYHPGGKWTSGFSSYHHYYINVSDGKCFLSKKVLDNGNDITQSTEELSVKTGHLVSPDVSRAVKVGPHTNDNNVTLTLSAGTLSVKGFDGMTDYGFRLTFNSSSGKSWKMTI